MKPKIIPSIISKNQREFDKSISKASKVSKIFHLDVMDGNFVKNESLNFNLELPREFKYEIHLMVKNPMDFIEDNLSKSSIILVHVESVDSKELGKIIRFVKNKKKKIGLVLSPRTSLDKVKPHLHKIDRVLFMTVYPGKYGAPFVPSVLKKVTNLRKIKPKLDIQVDGHVNPKNIGKIKEAGANIFVVGSYLMKSKDIKKSFKVLEKF